MRRSSRRQATAALLLPAVLAVTVLAACTPDGPPIPTPAPTSASPTETEQERAMRLDQEGAVASYRAAHSEISKLFAAGGASEAPPALQEVATDEFLAFTLRSLRSLKKTKTHTTGSGHIVYVAAQGWSPRNISVKACEDATKVRVIDNRGRDKTPDGPRRYVQNYTVSKVADAWKVSDLVSKPVGSFESYGCESR